MRDLNPRDIDAALTGARVPEGLESIASWAEDLRLLAATPIADDTATAHIASISTVASSGPAGTVQPAATDSVLHRIRRRIVLSSLLSGVLAKVFAASIALATVTGGVVATGALPDTIQDPIAGVYNSVGFDFPTSAADDSESGDPDTEPSPTVTTTDPTDDDGEGEPGGPDNTNGNKNGPNNTNGNKNGPGENNPNGPGDNNGKGPGNNNGKGPGNNNGNGPGNNNGNGPGDGDSDGPGNSGGKGNKGGGEGQGNQVGGDEG